MCNNNCNSNCGCNESIEPCECTEKDISTNCISYTGDDLECSGVIKGTILTEVIQKIDAFVCEKFIEVLAYFNVVNVGVGAKVFKGISNTGSKEMRSIVSESDELTITENEDTVGVSVDLSLYSTITYTDTEISELETNLTNYIDSSTSSSTTTISTEINTLEADLIAYTDNAVQDLASETYVDQAIINAQGSDVATILQDNGDDTFTYTNEENTQVTIDYSVNLTGLASETYVDNAVSLGLNVPTATETQAGIAEIATQTETNLGVDTEKIVTPATLVEYINSITMMSRIRNIGKISDVEVGDTVTITSHPTTGDIVSCTRTARTGNLDTFRIVFSSPMDSLSYYPRVAYEAVSAPQVANDKLPVVFQTVSTTELDLFIEATVGDNTDLVNIYIEIVQA